MLYHVLMKLSDGVDRHVVLGSRISRDGEIILNDFRKILGNSRVIQDIAQYGDRVQVLVPAQAQDSSIPALPVVVVDATSGNDVSSIYKFIVSNPSMTEAHLAPLTAHLVKGGMKIVEDEVKFIWECTGLLIKYLKGEDLFKVNAPATFFADTERTLSAVKVHNGRLGHQFQYISAETNVTNFMNSEDDTFYVEIPAYAKLRSEDFSTDYLLPKSSDICKPYPHPIYASVYARRVLEGSPSQISSALSLLNDDMQLKPEFRNNVPKINPMYVLGDSRNNDLPIQPNEEEYYNALIEYIKYDIKETYRDGDVEELFRTSHCSRDMLMYLLELLKLVTSMNWTHTDKYPIDKAILREYDDEPREDDDDDNDFGESELYSGMSGEIEPGHDYVRTFVEDAANSGMGLAAYVEAIIKMSRWGRKKPNVLRLGDFNQYLDLNTLIIRNTSGDFSSNKPVLIDGYEMEASALVLFDERYKDKDYLNTIRVNTSRVSVPVGLACKKNYSGGRTQIVYMSMIELIQAYRNNPEIKLIKGISFDGSSFKLDESLQQITQTISLRLVQGAVSQNVDKLQVFYISEGIGTMALEYSCQGISNLGILAEYLSAQNALTRWYGQLKFSTKEELGSLMTTTPMPVDVYVKVNIANVLIPIVMNASEIYETKGRAPIDLSGAFSDYLQVMSSLHYSSEDQFLVGRSSVPAVKEAVVSTPATESSMQKSSSFTGTTESSDQRVSTPAEVVLEESSVQQMSLPDQLAAVLVTPKQEGETVHALRDGGEDVVMGFILRKVNGRNTYILLGASEVPTGSPLSATSVATVQALVYESFNSILSGNIEKVRGTFNSKGTLAEITAYLMAKANPKKG